MASPKPVVRAKPMESGVYPKMESANMEEDCHANPAGKIFDTVTSAVTLNLSIMTFVSLDEDDDFVLVSGKYEAETAPYCSRVDAFLELASEVGGATEENECRDDDEGGYLEKMLEVLNGRPRSVIVRALMEMDRVALAENNILLSNEERRRRGMRFSGIV
eukprot:CCRYP_001181-RD/>CCRYP_001181-RD protein AED:0.46 eAED:1.00 QI:0/0/0/1/0/0/2/0/160